MTTRQTILFIPFLLVAAFAVGCGSTESDSADRPKQSETAAAQLDRAKTETKEAAQAVQDYTYAQKVEFIDEMRKELVAIQEELDRLSAKVDRSSGAVKDEAKTQLDAVRGKWDQANKKLDQAEGATESSWDDAKGGLKKSYGELKDSFEKTREWLSEKIAP